MGQSRVDVDRHIERLRPFVDRPEALVVVKDAGGHAVDHRAFEAEPGDGAFEFLGRGARVSGRQRGKRGEAVGMALHRLVQPVIDAARKRHAGRGIDALQSRYRVRQHLKVDTRFVHFFQPQCAEIVEPPDDFCPRAGAAMLLHLGIEVVLLQRNDCGFCRHALPPHYPSAV
jgi:hypothetical protein